MPHVQGVGPGRHPVWLSLLLAVVGLTVSPIALVTTVPAWFFLMWLGFSSGASVAIALGSLVPVAWWAIDRWDRSDTSKRNPRMQREIPRYLDQQR